MLIAHRGPENVVADFCPAVQRWFAGRFGEPTEAQRLGWPAIRSGRHTLIAAPTGSGKTLAAFLVCIDRLLRRREADQLENVPAIVYVSPLKALSNDIQQNLQQPLAEIAEIAATRRGSAPPPIRAAVRTGDTPSAERQSMLRRPPHILVTTPESLYLLLTAQRSRELLRHVETVIVDEIHALARDKRGSHLALSLARLDALCEVPPTRIGLSATQKPMDQIAQFLVGNQPHDADEPKVCQIIDVGHARTLDLAVEVPPTDLEAVCSMEQWQEVYDRLVELIESHRSTLVFVNTRRMAERVAHRLTERLGNDAVTSHHGSLARGLRLSAEQRLKAGTLKAIVATASLEMGIDVGYVDLVCQIGSPRSIATFIQRVGRSGHNIGAVPRGRLFPLTRDELLECMALIRAVGRGRLDAIQIPQAPLDILAQQIVAEVACRECHEDELYQLCSSAWPFRNLRRPDFMAVVRFLSEGLMPTVKSGRHLHRDAMNGTLRARRGARLTALTSGGAIPEMALFRVITVDDETFVGEVDEDFAIDSSVGDIFLLGNNSWQLVGLRDGKVLVRDAGGAPPSVPFWFGEAPGRTVELSEEVSQLRIDIGQRTVDLERGAACEQADSAECTHDERDPWTSVADWLQAECHANAHAARQAAHYVQAQRMALGIVPSRRNIVFERFFDESGGMQLVIHAPFGSRINRAWGLALRKRFCRSFDFELQAAATDDGILLSIGPQHSFPIESLFRMVHPENARYLIEQAVLAVPMLPVRWRWNVTRALAVARFRGGKKVPFHLQRYRADDLLAAVFPETVGCLENHEGDVEIPDHPLVKQTMIDCLHEAMDVNGWTEVLRQIQLGEIELVARETREPSPFSHQILNANPYAFLDGAGLDERRTRAVATRRGLPLDQIRDLARLDPDAIFQVVQDVSPVVRDAFELWDVLRETIIHPPSVDPFWQACFAELVQNQRATVVSFISGRDYWIATERWPQVRALVPDARIQSLIELPDALHVEVNADDALCELLLGWLARLGPVTVSELSHRLSLDVDRLRAGLEALEGHGNVMRGHYRQTGTTAPEIEWCDRRLLARIHQLTLSGLRRQIQPVEANVLVHHLCHTHRVLGEDRWGGAVAVREVVHLLQGCELPTGAWESHILSARIPDYDPTWMDQLFAAGELVWGRVAIPKPAADRQQRRTSWRLSRSTPISILRREDLDWLVSQRHSVVVEGLRGTSECVLEALQHSGAVFFSQLRSLTGLLTTQLEEALRELAAAGLITCDSFAAVRQLIRKPRGGRTRSRHRVALDSAPGRWSLFPGAVSSPSRQEVLERWCRQLLRRWGVVFRDILDNEVAAPSWFELVRTYRQWEARGDVRGGRFVAGVGGEQFGSNETVEQLRRLRDKGQTDDVVVLSAADPLNVFGLGRMSKDRVPAVTNNAIALRNGVCVARSIAGKIEALAHFAPEDLNALSPALRQGRAVSVHSLTRDPLRRRRPG